MDSGSTAREMAMSCKSIIIFIIKYKLNQLSSLTLLITIAVRAGRLFEAGCEQNH
jgi:hypothetical protein